MQQKRPILYYPEGTTGAKEIFSHLERLDIRSYTPDQLIRLNEEEPEILVANTRLKVNKDAVQKYPTVRIFATVSSGTDHVDFAALKETGRIFLNAPGCNAGSVAEYCFAGLKSRFSDQELKRLRVGMVGHGHTGKEFHKILKSFGVESAFYDPFYKAESVSLREVLSSDIVSYHVPLTKDGSEPTFRSVSESLIDSFKSGTVLINTSRGEIFTPEAFAKLLVRQDIFKICDVFDPEPPTEEFGAVLSKTKNSVFTPHIAGYSQIGRMSGTHRVAEKLSILYGDKTLPPLESFLETEGEFKTETFLLEEDRLLRDSWRNGDSSYFEKRRNSYPIRLDWGLV
ncbi:NAD(P)-dependent oxidoreductase [Leptospira stimsonii]|uniref:4-phosphoerythronate dehydrogenase n=1 Tax=Leptospira stimsonii TaxID=2202203 RepID=A0ABY2N5B7_9LEPT|nr:NAD(P)-dependent oxidoreductase [Leptospira stimsonii]TGK26925.1 4-phosphoerythronate dehydrogenase [Leptospira stimsonii]TGM17284.1 4-phosphoerythronate dehydrogenase [Leptospira stimsonii]